MRLIALALTLAACAYGSLDAADDDRDAAPTDVATEIAGAPLVDASHDTATQPDPGGNGANGYGSFGHGPQAR